jgi:hypothetical protein
VITRIYESLSPWLRRPSPLICRSNPPIGRRCDTGSQYVSDEVRDNKIGTCDNHASARIYSGYSVLRWKRCGNLTHFWHAPYRLHQHNVDMCIHIGVRQIWPATGRAPAPSGLTLMLMALKNVPSTRSYLRRAA